ncbi:MAG: helix-turn-helix domain-containing protein [Thermoguttaceae bacterium]
MSDKILTVEEAAEMLRCSQGTIRNLIKAKKLPAIRFGTSERGTVRIEAAQLEGFVEKMRTDS